MNIANKSFYNITHNKAKKSVDIDIYGAIIGGGENDKWDETDFTLDDFKNGLGEVENFDVINMNVSSPGGSMIVASAMMSILQTYKNKGVTINARILGLAASAASYLVMVADNIYIGRTAMMMVHKPMVNSLFFTANATQLRKIASELDSMEDGILMNAYMMKATQELSREKLKNFIEEETWFSSDECKKYFNINLIEDEFEMVARLNKNDFDILSQYKNTPKTFIESPSINNTNNTKINAIKTTSNKKQKIKLELDLI